MASHYSQYPTDDKKYECRTGPFEGFFVSSVEFCKHVKFDDKKDRNNEVGPPGPQGPAGPAGQPGITQLINGTNVYLVTRSVDSFASPLDVTALCEAGDFVINEGYLFSGSVGPNTIVGQNGPIISPPGEGWSTSIFFLPNLTIPATLTVNAFCFDNSP